MSDRTQGQMVLESYKDLTKWIACGRRRIESTEKAKRKKANVQGDGLE